MSHKIAVTDKQQQTLVRPHVMDFSLDREYQAMAADQEREAEAAEWCSSLFGDAFDETR